MPGTQWPRYQVFHQERPDRPHINAGTVHAPDAEIALQNARDVFVRRPQCASLWVVRAEAILSLTAEERERIGSPEPSRSGSALRTYQVFVKRTQNGSHEHVGEVEASSPVGALEQATESFAPDRALVWWVIPDESLARSVADDAEMLFTQGEPKPYRDQRAYQTFTLMRRVREGKVEQT